MPPFPLSFTLAFFEKKRLNLTGGGDISKHALGVTFLFGVDSGSSYSHVITSQTGDVGGKAPEKTLFSLSLAERK